MQYFASATPHTEVGTSCVERPHVDSNCVLIGMRSALGIKLKGLKGTASLPNQAPCVHIKGNGVSANPVPLAMPPDFWSKYANQKF